MAAVLRGDLNGTSYIDKLAMPVANAPLWIFIERLVQFKSEDNLGESLCFRKRITEIEPTGDAPSHQRI